MENSLPGTPQYIWDAEDGTGIVGFSTQFSVNKGDTIDFKIDIPEADTAEDYSIKIFRLGWYQGNGARLIEDLGIFSGSAQPPALYDSSTGKHDCSNWAVSVTWAVPSNVVSGVFIAKLETVSDASMIIFVVRDDSSNSALLFKTADATWQAYNKWGGNNLYSAETPVPGFTHAVKVSYDRPFVLKGNKSGLFNAEYPMIRWLERNGYDITYTTDLDMSKDPVPIVPAPGIPGTYSHKILLSVGHDEYWSLEEYNKFENARDAGVHLAFFSGNEVYWKVRWEDNYRTLVCYKEGTMGEYTCNGNCDPTNIWTGLWRDGCSSVYTADDACRPEGSLTGQMSWTQSNASIIMTDQFKNHRFWRHTSVANLLPGDSLELPYGILGYEWDPEQFTETYPQHRTRLSSTQVDLLTHSLSLYRHNSGAYVFGAGTIQYSWALDDVHVPGSSDTSAVVQQATVNLFRDMGQVAGSLQANLTAPAFINDTLPPISTITSHVHGDTISGSYITISGNTIDQGDGAIGGVEVSSDGGISWIRATGTNNWSCNFIVTSAGTMNFRVRSWDDFSNLETPGIPGSTNNITLNINGPFSFSVFPSNLPTAPPVFNISGAALEVGMKFRTSLPGFITGFKYYKMNGSTGTHTGHLWTSTGTLLAEAVFENETTNGWQYVTLQNPVAIDSNITYVVSCFSPTGSFVVNSSYFTSPVVNGLVRALANGEDGPNGVYRYAPASQFPDLSVSASNYWVDIVFTTMDFTPPVVTNTNPPDNSDSVSVMIHPEITFNENLDPSTINSTTCKLTGPGNAHVAGTISLQNGNKILFVPDALLNLNTEYTINLKGGNTGPRIKDQSGNTLGADHICLFVTEGLSSPTVTFHPVNVSSCQGSSVSFISNASGMLIPTVQWEVSSDSGSTWLPIANADSSVLNFIADSINHLNQFRAIWTNNQGADTSNPATLTIIDSVTVTLSVPDPVICKGEYMQLQLTGAVGQPPFDLLINNVNYTDVEVGDILSVVSTTETIWPASSIPEFLSLADPQPVELGVKFKSLIDGYISGIRFYKGPGNNGEHRGTLWSGNGTMLASAIFENETPQGWQEVIFDAPVAITANTVYVASYFAPQGYYSRSDNYFLSGGYSNGSFLEAITPTPAEPNGVYVYSPVSAFPSLNPGPQNYWVDVVFDYPENQLLTAQINQVIDNGGCSGGANQQLFNAVSGPVLIPSFVNNPDTSVCQGGSVTYTTQAGYINYDWSVSGSEGINYVILDGSLEDTSNSVTIQWLQSGPATISVNYSAGNCTAINDANAITMVHSLPDPSITGDSTVCSGSQVELQTQNYSHYLWSTGDTTSALLVGSAGTYMVTVTDSNGCSGTSNIFATVLINDIPQPSINGTSQFCEGGNTILDAGLYEQYNWSNGSITQLIQVSLPGVYSVTVTDINGCTGSAEVLTTHIPKPTAVITGNATICQGGSADLTINFTGTAPWYYSLNGSVTDTIFNNSILLNVSPIATTDYTLTYFADSSCESELTDTATVIVSMPLSSTAPVFNTYSLSSCVGNTILLAVNPVANASAYTWSAPAGTLINGSTGPVITSEPFASITFGTVPSGVYGWTICVNASNACNSSNNACRFIRGILGTPSSIAGSKVGCAGSSGTYSINSINGAEFYQWTGTGGITFTGSGTSVQANFPSGFTSGTICVRAGFTCGYLGPSRCLPIASALTMPGTMTGTFSICPGQTGVVYSVPLASGSTSYTWSVPAGVTISSGQGTNSVTLDYAQSFVGGQVCVYATSVCGTNSPSRCKSIASLSPKNPGAITGDVKGVCGQAITYSIAPVTGASSYTWTLPPGAIFSGDSTGRVVVVVYPSSNITGQLCVVGNNSCGSSLVPRCLTVTTVPSNPGVITGQAGICAGQTGVSYSIAPVFGATSYLWTLPAGASFVSGQGTNSIVVNFGNSGGNLLVKALNACGISGSRKLVISVNCRTEKIIEKTIVATYPNPVNDILHLAIEAASDENLNITLSDPAGRIVNSFSLKVKAGFNTHEMDMSPYSNGIYILSILQHEGISKQIKLVVD